MRKSIYSLLIATSLLTGCATTGNLENRTENNMNVNKKEKISAKEILNALLYTWIPPYGITMGCIEDWKERKEYKKELKKQKEENYRK